MKRIIPLAAAVALLALSCGEEEGVTPPGPERPEATSPAAVLENVEISFNQPDIKILLSVLSKDFVFLLLRPGRRGPEPAGEPIPYPGVVVLYGILAGCGQYVYRGLFD